MQAWFTYGPTVDPMAFRIFAGIMVAAVYAELDRVGVVVCWSTEQSRGLGRGGAHKREEVKEQKVKKKKCR